MVDFVVLQDLAPSTNLLATTGRTQPRNGLTQSQVTDTLRNRVQGSSQQGESERKRSRGPVERKRELGEEEQ